MLRAGVQASVLRRRQTDSGTLIRPKVAMTLRPCSPSAAEPELFAAA